MYHQEIIEAVKANNVAEVKRLLEAGANPNTDMDDVTPADITPPVPLLGFAAERGFEEIVALLLQHHAEIDRPSKLGTTPLRLSLSEKTDKHFTIAQMLVKAGADINYKRSSDNGTVFHGACISGNLRGVKYLASLKANVNEYNKKGWGALHYAAESGHLEVIEFCINELKLAIDKPNGGGTTPLMVAVSNDKPKVVEFLLSKGASTQAQDNDGWNLLFYAAQAGNVSLIELCLKTLKLPIEYTSQIGNTSLMIAAVNGQKEAVRYLLSQGANCHAINHKGWNVLMQACNADNDAVEIVDLLLARGLDQQVHQMSKEEGWTALRLAVAKNNLKTVTRLLQVNGIDPNLRSGDTRWMWSPLNVAAIKNLSSMVSLLLTAPTIDVNQHDYYHDNPLLNACEKGYLDIVELLLAAPSINVNVTTVKGESAIQLASEHGHEEIEMLLRERPEIKLPDELPLFKAIYRKDTQQVSKLLAQGHIDVNEKNAGGMTPLYIACEKNMLAIVKVLLKQPNIDVNEYSGKGETALFIAVANKNVEVVAELLKHPHIKVNRGAPCWGNQTPLCVAAEYEDTRILEMLLHSTHIKVNKSRYHRGNDGWAPIHFAISKGRTAAVKLLAAHPDFDVNLCTAEWTGPRFPLINAAVGNEIEITKILLANPKLNLNQQRKKDGFTALTAACVENHIEIVQLLVQDARLDPNIPNHNSETPLMLAIAQQADKLIDVLLMSPKLKINQVTSCGSALHYAVIKNNLNAIKLLIKQGADLSLKANIKGATVTAKELAAKHNLTAIVELLAQEEQQKSSGLSAKEATQTLSSAQLAAKMWEQRSTPPASTNANQDNSNKVETTKSMP